jgi:hypothetical protein
MDTDVLHHPHGRFEKCTIPDKQHDLLNNTVENNIIMKLLTYTINPTTEGWLCGTTKNISVP